MEFGTTVLGLVPTEVVKAVPGTQFVPPQSADPVTSNWMVVNEVK